MNCQEARLHIGSQPDDMSAALAEHLQQCAACRGFRDEMTMLDGRIRRALDLEPRAIRAAPRVREQRSRRWAMAASLLVAVAAGVLVWTLRPADTLAAEIVAHVGGEPASWSRREPVPQSALDFVVRDAGIEIDASDGRVVYAHSCVFRGRTVPHLVVSTAQGPMTVLVLRHERVESPQRFSEDGYTGLLLPSPSGAFAVLARGDTDIEKASREIQTIIRSNLRERA
ncbi:MAG: DUF3379 family protein [Steroidobacteraceae bacterium]